MANFLCNIQILQVIIFIVLGSAKKMYNLESFNF